MSIDVEDIKIRTHYQPGDMGYMLYMHSKLYDFGLSFEMYVAESLAVFIKNLDPSKERIWIAEYQEKMIGSIAIKNTDDKAQLRYFLIDPEYRGLGLGRHLMNQFMAFYTITGYKSSFLLTENSLATAIHLYKSYGYVYVSSKDTSFGLTESRYELVTKTDAGTNL